MYKNLKYDPVSKEGLFNHGVVLIGYQFFLEGRSTPKQNYKQN